MILDPLRLYLLAGLLAHKALWEWMKRGRTRTVAPELRASLVKVVKIGILAGIVLQTVMPEILPIARDAGALRTIGAALFTFGLATAILGRVQLGSNWSDIEAAEIRREHAVVSKGIYGFIRHPIYTGDLLLLVGLELALNSWLVLGAIALVPLVLRQAVREEQGLAATLPGYADYCARTKRFIPFVA